MGEKFTALSNMILAVCCSKLSLPDCYIFTLLCYENWCYVAGQVGIRNSKLVRSNINDSATESQGVQPTNHEGCSNSELYRFNSLLDPSLAVCDLDSIEINPEFFRTFRVT